MSGLENDDGLDNEFEDITISSNGQLPLFGSSNYTQIGNNSLNSVINSTSGNTISIGSSSSSNGVIGTGSNSVWISPTTTTIPSNNWIYQQPIITTTGSGSFTVTNASTNNDKYAVFNLPRKKVPEAVYVAGRMVTLGLLGTDVECAYVSDRLIFSPGVLSIMRYNERITLILQYANTMYHYKVHHNFGLIEMMPESNVIVTTLLSEIKREKNVQAR